MAKTNKGYSIRRRIIVQFCLFSILLSGVFSAYNFLFLYVIEDVFIERGIAEEATHLTQQFEATGVWSSPSKANMVLHHSVDTFPPAVKAMYLQEPMRKEFFGEAGRHYHLYLILVDREDKPVYLLAEVSQQLVVRPFSAKIMISLLVSALMLTVLACFIAYRLANRMIKPLSDLALLVDGVSADQLPESFAHRYPDNEIGILAQTLEASMQRIKAFVEREQHFTRDASHELRTPIAIVKNATELLALKANSNSGLDEGTKTLLKRISRAGLQMEQTVSTLLSLAREENNDAVAAPVKLLPVVERVIVENAYLLDNKAVEVNVDIAPGAEVVSQAGILHILLANLISNAFQYTSAGEVTIAFADNCLQVSDTGPGVEENIKDNLLDPLVKGSESQGFGIGLSIVKRLCERHQLGLVIGEKDGDGQAEGMVVSIGFAGL